VGLCLILLTLYAVDPSEWWDMVKQVADADRVISVSMVGEFVALAGGPMAMLAVKW
jgi:hypothetical protein